MAQELLDDGIAVNALWPRTLIATSALNVSYGGATERARTPDIMADAAYRILTQPSKSMTGQFLLDEAVLRDAGIDDFSGYQVTPSVDPILDLFVDL